MQFAPERRRVSTRAAAVLQRSARRSGSFERLASSSELRLGGRESTAPTQPHSDTGTPTLSQARLIRSSDKRVFRAQAVPVSLKDLVNLARTHLRKLTCDAVVQAMFWRLGRSEVLLISLEYLFVRISRGVGHVCKGTFVVVKHIEPPEYLPACDESQLICDSCREFRQAIPALDQFLKVYFLNCKQLLPVRIGRRRFLILGH